MPYLNLREIDDELFRRLKAQAAYEGEPMAAFCIRVLRERVEPGSAYVPIGPTLGQASSAKAEGRGSEKKFGVPPDQELRETVYDEEDIDPA